MIHFKTRHNGFSLLEVMMTMVIVAFVLLPIFNLLSRVLHAVETESQRLDQIVEQKKLLLKTLDSSLDLQNKKIVTSVNAISELAHIEGLQRQEVSISWSDLQGEHEERLIYFVYVQPEEKKEKK